MKVPQSTAEPLSLPIEQHYTVAQIAEHLQVSDDTVRRIFAKQPGVVLLAQPNGVKRRYTTFIVTESVLRAYLTACEVHTMPKRRRAA